MNKTISWSPSVLQNLQNYCKRDLFTVLCLLPPVCCQILGHPILTKRGFSLCHPKQIMNMRTGQSCEQMVAWLMEKLSSVRAPYITTEDRSSGVMAVIDWGSLWGLSDVLSWRRTMMSFGSETRNVSMRLPFESDDRSQKVRTKGNRAILSFLAPGFLTLVVCVRMLRAPPTGQYGKVSISLCDKRVS